MTEQQRIKRCFYCKGEVYLDEPLWSWSMEGTFHDECMASYEGVDIVKTDQDWEQGWNND